MNGVDDPLPVVDFANVIVEAVVELTSSRSEAKESVDVAPGDLIAQIVVVAVVSVVAPAYCLTPPQPRYGVGRSGDVSAPTAGAAGAGCEALLGAAKVVPKATTSATTPAMTIAFLVSIGNCYW